MRIVFFGTPDFAVPSLDRLVESPHKVLAVVCQPDKPAGRGRKLKAPPVKERAIAHGLPVHQPDRLRGEPGESFARELEALEPDVAVVIAYGKILPRRLLNLPRHGCLNVHASLLPRYRGAAPIQWALVRGERQTGVSIMQLDEGMDTGPVAATREVDILDDDDARSLSDILSFTGAELLLEVLGSLEETGSLHLTPQDEAMATYASLIKRSDALIEWSRPADEIICAIRGFRVWPKAYTHAGDKELKIIGAEACAAEWVNAAAFHEKVEPGTVVEVLKGRGFVVRAGGEGTQGLVMVTAVQPEGRGEMPATDFVNGGGIEVGDRLKS